MSEQPASDWTQALLTGNGVMGAMVMGYPYHDTLIVNHALLYRPQTAPKRPVSQGKHLEQIREMMLSGDFQKAADYVVELSHSEGYGDKIWTDSYIPAFDLLIDQRAPAAEKPQSYARTVDFESGIACVKWSDSQGAFARETFVSRKDNLIVTRLTASLPAGINCSFTLRERVEPNWWAGIDPRPSKETHDVAVEARDGYLTYTSTFDNQIKGLIKSYCGAVRVINKGGTLQSSHGVIKVAGADEVILLTRVEPCFDSPVPPVASVVKALGSYKPNFQKLLSRHEKLHGELMNRVSIDLGGNSSQCTLSTEEMFKQYATGGLNPTLLEKEFYAARYHLISATGINAPNLQGIWSGTTSSPWSGDYTTNGNLPVAISSMLSSNLPELMLSTFNMLERHETDFETNAQVLFGTRGIHVPSRFSSHGLNNHFDATWPMTFWTAGAAWYASYYYDYYLYTGDKKFLASRALPFMEKAVEFYEDFLIKDKSGKNVFVPSYSPENNPANNPSQACVNATMDVMAAGRLLRDCIEASRTLGINSDRITRWQQMLNDLPPYELNSNGELREWMWPGIEENHSHRHVSHLYGLYDRVDPQIKASASLQEGCRRVIEQRMKVRRQDNGGIMVFGLVMMGDVACNLHDAATAGDILGWISQKYWNRNMFTNHDPGTLFNCDLTGGFQQLIIKMLVYSEPGSIEILPALPAALAKGGISGLLLRGGIHLNSLTWSEDHATVELTSAQAQTVKLRLPREMESCSWEGKGKIEKQSSPRDLQLQLPAGKRVKLVIQFK